MENECIEIEVARRIADLCEAGCRVAAINVAINRATDASSLRVNIGIIEDLFFGKINMGRAR